MPFLWRRCQIGETRGGEKESRDTGHAKIQGDVLDNWGAASCSVMGGVFTEPSEEVSEPLLG